ncbi:MAG: ATP-binding protein [Bacteroidota bacterium]
MKHFFLLLFTLSLLEVAAQNSVLDSLLRVDIKSLDNEVDEVDLFNEIAWEFNAVNKDSTRLYATQARSLAEAIRYYNGQIRALNLLAIVYSLEENIDSSIILNELALAMSKEHDLLEHRDALLNDLGLDYGVRGDYEKELLYLHEALELGTAEEDDFLVYTIKNIAITHIQLGNEAQAAYYIEQALEKATNSSDVQLIHNIIDLKAFFFRRQEQYDSSLHYRHKAYQFALNNNLEVLVANDLISMASIYSKQEDYETCIYCLEQLRLQNEENSTNYRVVDYYRLLADCHEKKGKLDEALRFRLEAKAAAAQKEDQATRSQVNLELSETYQAMGNYQKAYETYVAHSELEKELFSADKAATILKLEKTFQNKQAREKNELLQSQKQTLERSNQLLNIVLVFLFLATLTGFILYISRNRTAKDLESKNEALTKLNQELEITKQEALEASAAKQDFLSRMSHEIRTPMNAVIGFSNILLDEKPRLDQLPYLHHLKSAGQYMMNLVNNLLDYSKLEAGKLRTEEVPFNLYDLLKEVVDTFKIINTNDELAIHLHFEEKGLNRTVLGASFRLNQVLYNLMSNAVKFTPKGVVKLSAEVLAIDQVKDEAMVYFEVKDSGIGIPETQQAHIFESFSQADSSTSRNYGGTGLGLSIVSDLLRLMNSEIQLKSKVGEGSSFHFQMAFPLGEPLSAFTANTSAEASIVHYKFGGLKILLAEDNLFNQKIASKILENKDMEVTTAINGLEALNAMENQDFDLVLMDLHMPVMDGYEAVEKIRQLAAPKKNIPIILLSATTLDPFINKIRNIDVEYYIEKPFSPEVLYEAIAKCMKQNQSLVEA